VKVNMDQATAERLIGLLESEADPGLGKVRESLRRALDPAQFGAKLTSDELRVVVDAVDAASRSLAMDQTRRFLLRERALPKLQTMLDRAEDQG
jgi:hypothetical protein